MQFCDVCISLHDGTQTKVGISGLSNKLQNEGISVLAWEEQVLKMKQLSKVALLVLICDDKGAIISQYPSTIQKVKSVSKLIDHDYFHDKNETKLNGDRLPNSKMERSVVSVKLANYFVLAVLPQDVYKRHAWYFLENVKTEILTKGIQNAVTRLPELFEQGNSQEMNEIDTLIADMETGLNSLRVGEQVLTDTQVEELEIAAAQFKAGSKKQCRIS